MKEHELKRKIGITYLSLSIIVFLMAFMNKIFIYVAFSILGLSLRAFHFSYINMGKEVEQGSEKHCYGNYYIYYPLLLGAILALIHLLFFDSFIVPRIEGCFINPAIAFICLYIGFDIYRIAGKHL